MASQHGLRRTRSLLGAMPEARDSAFAGVPPGRRWLSGRSSRGGPRTRSRSARRRRCARRAAGARRGRRRPRRGRAIAEGRSPSRRPRSASPRTMRASTTSWPSTGTASCHSASFSPAEQHHQRHERHHRGEVAHVGLRLAVGAPVGGDEHLQRRRSSPRAAPPSPRSAANSGAPKVMQRGEPLVGVQATPRATKPASVRTATAEANVQAASHLPAHHAAGSTPGWRAAARASRARARRPWSRSRPSCRPAAARGSRTSG